MHRIGVFLVLAMLCQPLFYLRGPDLLIVYTHLELLDLFQQRHVLEVERINEFLDVHALVA